MPTRKYFDVPNAESSQEPGSRGGLDMRAKRANFLLPGSPAPVPLLRFDRPNRLPVGMRPR